MYDSQLPAIVWRGENIPLLTLGTAQLGLSGYGVANRTSGMTQERVDAIVKTAWESGVRFFDTAQAYGDSEERLGQAFRNLGLIDADGKAVAHVVTKLAPDLDCADTKAIAASLELSQARLGQECIWGVMLHRYAWLAEWENSLGDALKKFREQGGAKYFGVSVYDAEEALTAIRHPDMDIIQIPANAWDGRMTRAGVFEQAREQGKLLFVRSVFLQGLLFLSPEEAEAKVPGAGRPAEVWAGLCRQYGCSSLELAVNWAVRLQCPLVIGAEMPEQIAEIVKSFQTFVPSLEEDPFLYISAIRQDTHMVIDPRLWSGVERQENER